MNYIDNIHRAYQWFENNSTENAVYVTSKEKRLYPEVTGYYIPTLLNYGFRNKAINFANYLASTQDVDGSWKPPVVFDVAQIIDGLSEFENKYENNIKKAIQWITLRCKNGKFMNQYQGEIGDHIYMRVAYCLSKTNQDVQDMVNKITSVYYNDAIFKFTEVSHFYAYAFEGCARLGLDCKKFVDEISAFEYLPERPNATTYCYTGLSQIALSLFLIGEYEKGMKYLEFVTKLQSNNGGFLGSNGVYFSDSEPSWGVKFYLDAFLEGQKLWFKNNLHIFASYIEHGDKDERFIFIKNNIKESDNVLEVGCGKGRYINNLNCNRFACDIADASKYVDAKFKIGSCLRLPYDDNVFDVVFASEVLEHSIFVKNAIEECLRVLKPNGKLLIIDKDARINFNGLHFGEKWLDFIFIKDKYKAEVNEIKQFSVPFCTAKIIKP